MLLWRSFVLLACLPLVLACGAGRLEPGTLRGPLASTEVAVGPFTLQWRNEAGAPTSLRVLAGERVVLSSLPGRALVGGGRGGGQVHESRGHFRLEDRLVRRCGDQTVETLEQLGAAVRLAGQLSCDGGAVPYSLLLEALSAAELRLTLAAGEDLDRAALHLASSADERAFGLGTQSTWFDLKGAEVPIVVSEQGVGRGAFPITLGAELTSGAGGDWHTSYAPAPHLLTTRLRSLFLENAEPSVFDLREPSRITVTAWSAELRARVVVAASPLELVERYTAYAGRMPPLPPWLHAGAVVGLQGGTARVREVHQRLRAAGTPVSAFWLQDWVGQRTTTFGRQLWWNWELDEDHYPGWDALRDELSADGVRVMGYINPYLADVSDKPNVRRDLYAEAEALGHLVETPEGAPYQLLITSFSAGVVDLTRPAARDWLSEVLRSELLARGFSGWMADFGEGLPFDAVLHQGTPLQVHNTYPELWAELNRGLVDEAPASQRAFFTRAGFTRSPRHTTLSWLGDQLVSWDAHDGIKSAVVGLLSSGLSGYSLQHSDIGGYTTIDNPLQNYHRSPELLRRWTELAAFTAAFRTHEGNRPDRNAQVYSDAASIAHFARMARLFQAWAPYRQVLMEEAAQSGAPLVRHLWLHHPDDEVARGLRYECFLVGSELLVAPVLDPGVTRARAYLPAGEWVHLWTAQTYGGQAAGQWVTVPAPIGQPAVFFRKGSAEGEAFRDAVEAAGLL